MEQEEAPVDIEMDVPIAAEFKRRKKLGTKRREPAKEKAAFDGGGVDGFSDPNEKNRNEGEFPPGVTVSVFDYSVENHFRAVDTISRLCGESDPQDFDPAEIRRLASSITFLREWRQFSYPSRALRFSCQNQSKMGKGFAGSVTLPQFSSATVPKTVVKKAEATFPVYNKDFVMHVGGLVSALDWCPRVHSHSNSIRSEFIAVAAHPPESCYHKIGAPVMGRGMVQVWCVLSLHMKKGMPSQDQKKQKRTSSITKSSEKKRPRGRPRKHPIDVNINSSEKQKPLGRRRKTALSNSQMVGTPAVPASEHSSTLPSPDVDSANTKGFLSEEDSVTVQEVSDNVSADKSVSSISRQLEVKARTGIQDAKNASFVPILDKNAELSHQDSPTAVNLGPDAMSCDSHPPMCFIPDDVALPRMVLGLAHNGKVAWDMKWRPSGVCDKHRMGYLAVLLGNGALEVWEVPFPHAVKVIYSDSQKDTNDPRFIKLQPVFRCSTIKCGDRQSIPLSLEWSASSPHDKILAGCHDGVVALWKFSGTSSSEDTRPLLCFSADTVPIRALSWAPVESSSESSNVMVTAGHKGLKFWDLRDPFRPLWDFNPIQRIIYALDWLSDPRCIIVAFDDGTLRILSMSKAVCDVPVTGKPFVGTQQQGFHNYYCSQFPIWSVHTSRSTGMVAYCGADGTALRFQLTTRAVEKDPRRNRASHFLCGLLTEEDSTLTMFTPLPNIPFPMRKSLTEWAETPRTKRGFSSNSNQEKRANEKMKKVQISDVQPQVLHYGSDSEFESGDNDNVVAPPSKRTSKTKSSSNKKLEDDQQSICGDDNPDICGDQQTPPLRGGVEKEAIKEVEKFPPRRAAMHKIRWNINVGSENWLCYGGAAGVLRCQEMDISGV